MAHAPRFLAVDSSFLITLAVGDPACEAAVDYARRLRLYITVGPASLQSLYDIANSSSPIKDNAQKAIEMLPTWGFLLDGLSDVDDFVAKEAAKYIQKALSLTYTESLILAQVSVAKCVLFLSDDNIFHTCVGTKVLDLVLLDRDLDGFVCFDPVSFSGAVSNIFDS